MKTLIFSLCIGVSALAQNAHFVYPLPAESAIAKRNIVYMTSGAESYSFDLYKPAVPSASLPVVIFVNVVGKVLGPVPFRDHPQYAGWGQLIAGNGFAAIVMESEKQKAVYSFDQLVAYLQANDKALGIDASRIVIYACSANVQAGIPILTDPARKYLKGALVFYGYGQVNQYRMDLPVIVFRAGLDGRSLNANLDQIVAGAIQHNAPWTLINASDMHHGFEVVDDNEQSRALIRQALAFIADVFNPRLQSSTSQINEAEAAGYAYSGNWKDAAQSYQRMVEADPKNSFAHWRLAEALAALAEHRNAIAHFRQALLLGNGNVGMISVAAAKEAMALGDKDTALDFLRNVKTIPVVVNQIKDDPAFQPLRDDPRFAEIIHP